jgi:mono/diheme cytochrome c family protein
MKSSRFAFLPVALIAALMLAIAGCGGDDTTSSGSGATAEAAQEKADEVKQDAKDQAEEKVDEAKDNVDAEGKEVFASNCAGCHTLAAADATGTTGPNLDDAKPTLAATTKQVTAGGGGMPAYKDTLSAEQIAAVSAYVANNAGK